MTTIGERIASGRSADIYECGDGRVLCRRRNGPVSEAEVVVMRAVHAAGFPVPEVFDVDRCDMTMERLAHRRRAGRHRLGRRPDRAARRRCCDDVAPARDGRSR